MLVRGRLKKGAGIRGGSLTTLRLVTRPAPEVGKQVEKNQHRSPEWGKSGAALGI